MKEPTTEQKSAVMSWVRSKVKTPREPKLSPCVHCGAIHGVRAMRLHLQICPVKNK